MRREERVQGHLYLIYIYGDSVLRITWNLTTTDKMIGHMIWVLQLEKRCFFWFVCYPNKDGAYFHNTAAHKSRLFRRIGSKGRLKVGLLKVV